MPTEPKRIEFSDHAEERMAQRGVSRSQLTSTIRQPTRILAGNAAYTKRFEREFHPHRLLVVIVEELDDCFKVVTAFWKGLG